MNIKQSDMVFTKEHTQIAKGIAILLMVYHHLFVIPERLNNNFFAVPNVFGYDIQSIMANFSKICVCIFVFLSGIGLFYSLSKEKTIIAMYKRAGLKALRFMINFWVIALIVYPIGVLLRFFPFDVHYITKAIFADLSGVMEWWFVRQYIVLLAIAPVFIIMFQKNNNLSRRVFPFFILCICYFFVRLLLKFNIIVNCDIFLSYFWLIENIPCILTFIVGIVVARYNIYSYYARIKYSNLVSVLCVMIAIIVRFIFSNNAISMSVDFFVVPLFVFGTTTLFYNTPLSKILGYFAKHSINIWLTHTFWCYYFFQNVVLIPYYSPLIYIWLLILSLFSSYLINLIYLPLNNLLFSKEHKFSYKNYFFKTPKIKKLNI